MTDSGLKADKALMEILECPICMNAFTDPRMLPCIHTFCSECLKQTAEANQKKPGDTTPCPLCRKDFTIPSDGVNGVPKNFFMENLLQYKTTLQMGSMSVICDICKARDEGKTGKIPKATMRCLECQDNYCDSCSEVHQIQKLSKDHKVEQIQHGNDASPVTEYTTVKYCSKHPQKHLEYFCADCKEIVCVSCFVESHSSHICKDVTTLDKEFRKTIENKANKISAFKNEMSSMRNNQEKRKSGFLKEIDEKKKEILRRNQELKRMIDQQTQTLLNELSLIKSNHLKEIENEIEEIERCCTILRSFEAYCTELRLNGSASDVCSYVDQLIVRADELELDHESFIGRPQKSIKLSLQTTDLVDVLQKSNSNLVGHLKDTKTQSENFAVFMAITNEVVKVNLQRPYAISTVEQIPSKRAVCAVTAVYCNTMYLTGVGNNSDEIWKYDTFSGWMKCASFGQGRRNHDAVFIDEVLYICGGYVDSKENVLDSVEAYNAITDKCTIVGKLVHCVVSWGNCVPVKNSLYIFGGGYDGKYNHVQVYNTKENKCSVLSKPMPHPYCDMRAVLWDTSVILLGSNSCFIFNTKSESWQERKGIKTGISCFSLVLENEKVFLIGGKEVRYIPLQNILDNKPIEWKTHATFPVQSHLYKCVKMRFLV